ncbi:MAG: hypothetical protein ACSLE1_18200 [Sphingobium sp.]
MPPRLGVARALMVKATLKPSDWVVTQGSLGASLFARQVAQGCRRTGDLDPVF